MLPETVYPLYFPPVIDMLTPPSGVNMAIATEAEGFRTVESHMDYTFLCPSALLLSAFT